MNSIKIELCRLCGTDKESGDLVCELNDIQDETLTMKDYVEYYCRTHLDNDKKFSQKVCRNCRLQIELFIAFSDNLCKVQRKIQGPSVDVTSKIKIRKSEAVSSN
jgi:hypothetical protein